jgi:RNA polymerase-binding transcription factor DksA
MVAPRLRQELADLLVRERNRLRLSIGALAAAERSLGESQAQERGGDDAPADLVSDLVEQAVDQALGHGERERLGKVEAALGRLAAGTYGICAECGRPIATERLYARPWSTRCIACAARAPGCRSRQ